jgi:5-methylcytosine-specific restriction protein A
MEIFYAPQEPDFIRRERAKARALRATQWWRNLLGKGECHHCGKRFPKEALTMDHLVPISRGGRSTKFNIVLSCKSCNSIKKNQTMAELRMKEIEGL